MMTWIGSHGSLVRKLFDVGIGIKAASAAVEFAGAIVVYTSGPRIVARLSHVAYSELLEHPGNVLASFALREMHGITSGAQRFATLYLLVSAFINVVLVAGLLSQRLFAFPVALAFLATFAAYQTQRFIRHPHPILAYLVFVDLFVIASIYLEYRRRLSELPSRES